VFIEADSGIDKFSSFAIAFTEFRSYISPKQTLNRDGAVTAVEFSRGCAGDDPSPFDSTTKDIACTTRTPVTNPGGRTHNPGRHD
jgi:hypothetical protein